MQLFLQVIGRTHIRRHQSGKYRIHKSDDFRHRSIVHPQFPAMACIRNTIADIAELLRRGITEPINALLHITDHGKFGCISADFANESILQGVIILAFIHINISPLSTDTLGHVRLLHGIQCPESHITELRYGLLLFHKRILLVERGDERNQSFESSRSDLIKRVHLFSGKG